MARFFGIIGNVQKMLFLKMLLYFDLALFLTGFIVFIVHESLVLKQVYFVLIIQYFLFIVFSIYCLVQLPRKKSVVCYLYFNYSNARKMFGYFSALLLVYVLIETLIRILGTLQQKELVGVLIVEGFVLLFTLLSMLNVAELNRLSQWNPYSYSSSLYAEPYSKHEKMKFVKVKKSEFSLWNSLKKPVENQNEYHVLNEVKNLRSLDDMSID